MIIIFMPIIIDKHTHIYVRTLHRRNGLYCMNSSDAKPSKCHLKFSSLLMIFIKLVYLSSVISLKWQ